MVPAQGLVPPVGILSGVTASGKTALAMDLCRVALKRDGRPSVEIINADSLQVYRGLDVGTAKPTASERAEIPHWLIDQVNPEHTYTAGDFSRDAHAAIEAIHARGNRALIVGGTGFYLKALLYGLWDVPPADPLIRAELEALSGSLLHRDLQALDPEAAQRIGPQDKYRLVRALEIYRLTGHTPSQLRVSESRQADSRFRLWVVDRADLELESRISVRTRQMIAQGILTETQDLLALSPEPRCLQAVGYWQSALYLRRQPPPGRKPITSPEDLAREIDLATRQLVKSQRTWFKKEPAAQAFFLDQDREKLWQEMLSLYGLAG